MSREPDARASRATPEPGEARFRATLVRVLVVQAIALALLGLIQVVYNAPTP
jgi:hypothetical protein